MNFVSISYSFDFFIYHIWSIFFHSHPLIFYFILIASFFKKTIGWLRILLFIFFGFAFYRSNLILWFGSYILKISLFLLVSFFRFFFLIFNFYFYHSILGYFAFNFTLFTSFFFLHEVIMSCRLVKLTQVIFYIIFKWIFKLCLSSFSFLESWSPLFYLFSCEVISTSQLDHKFDMLIKVKFFFISFY